MHTAALSPLLPKLPPRKSSLEWIGGRRTMPIGIRIDDEVHYPEVFLWLELPTGFVVRVTSVDPRHPITFAQSLMNAMSQPAEGAARCPERIRVSDEATADEVRQSIGDAVQVIVAECPEIDDAFEEVVETVWSSTFQTYLGGGRTDPDCVRRLFSVAARLFRAAPWRDVCEDQLVQVDIPKFGIERACLSVIGGGKEDHGLLLFASFEAYLHFASGPPMAEVEDLVVEQGKTAMLSLSFDRKKELPPQMLDEITRHGWPVAGPRAYPVILAVDRESMPQRVHEGSVQAMTALTEAFLQFLDGHRAMFAEEVPERVCKEIFTEEGIAVTFTAPFEDFLSLVPAPPPPVRSAPRAGRNDPCPCGSGKKYKKCHLDADARVTL